MNISGVITNPRLLFPLYLVLTNTFLITTHYPNDPIEKYENAEMWMTLVSVLLLMRLNPSHTSMLIDNIDIHDYSHELDSNSSEEIDVD
jgi:hypothetical protein